MEKTKRDSRHIDPLKDEEKFFQWLKFKSVRMNQEHLSKDDYERLRQRIHVSLRMLRRKRTVRRVAYYGVLWRANLCATFLGNLVYPTPASKMLHFP